MIPQIGRLSDAETELVLKSPLLVCILIAGADGKIDDKEIKEALAIARGRHRVKSVLFKFFQEMAQDFEDKLKVLIQSYPYDALRRNEAITNELGHLNKIWKKLDNEFSVAYYGMLKDLAHRIASSSGGIWGMKKIAVEEAEFLHLPMLVDPSKN